jgi:hypothetical protein
MLTGAFFASGPTGLSLWISSEPHLCDMFSRSEEPSALTELVIVFAPPTVGENQSLDPASVFLGQSQDCTFSQKSPVTSGDVSFDEVSSDLLGGQVSVTLAGGELLAGWFRAPLCSSLPGPSAFIMCPK